ncbi:unnamed protein product [Clonostachys solani]|uniref:Polyketide synthase n=1 Tax=Clonostachys solani TaxID=160281 RepID=A0A9N9Z9U2_9HYPO|nr:unnamed protein product [Clonostachys solani]
MYSSSDTASKDASPPRFQPLAICGMSTRLPGGISSPEDLWEFLLNKGDACARIPPSRWATHGPQGNSPGQDAESTDMPDTPHWKTHSYMLNDVDIGAFDAGLFSMTRAELGMVDPQQRLLLEITRECLESAGEMQWRGKDIGVYIGSLGEDWNDVQYHDRHDLHTYKLTGTGDFVLSNRISYEYDLRGPSLTVRTACSSSLYGLDLACQAIHTGQASSALVGGVNLMTNPAKTETMVHFGVLSKGVSSKSFDADADGYARGEAVSMIYIKKLEDAIRDGNPIRAVIRSAVSNADGKTSGLTKPSGAIHESLIRSAYRAAGLESEIGRTGFFECHATGTSSGDPQEAGAVGRIFKAHGGIYMGSIKPNLGHAEGASGLSSLMKCVMALEHKTIPPNIKLNKPNPNIPFKRAGLRVPLDAVPWPQDRSERTSINSFGVGGANSHVILESAASFGVPSSASATSNGVHPTSNGVHPTSNGVHPTSNEIHPTPNGIHPTPNGIHPTPNGIHPISNGVHPTTNGHSATNGHVTINGEDAPANGGSTITNGAGTIGKNAQTKPSRLIPFTANDADSARQGAVKLSSFLASHSDQLDDAAYTIGMRRQHFPYRSFTVVNKEDAVGQVTFSAPIRASPLQRTVVFVFTGQGSQWPTMGSALLSDYHTAMEDVLRMDKALASLGQDVAPTWTLAEQLRLPKESSQVYKADFSQPLCTAIQIIIVNLLRSWGIQCAAVIGHSSGEIAAAYAAGALSMDEAIICAYLRGRATTKYRTKMPQGRGGMAAVGLGSTQVQKYLTDGVVIACENSPLSTTISGDDDKLTEVLDAIKKDQPEVFARRLAVDMAYHSHHMKLIGSDYEKDLAPHIQSKWPLVKFLSTVTNEVIEVDGALGAAYWRSNLESPVLFNTGLKTLLQQTGGNTVLIEIGPHSALSGPIRQILNETYNKSPPLYVPTLIRSENESKALLTTAGQLFCQGQRLRFDAINPIGHVLPTLPTYPWNHGTSYWYESRVSREYRGRHFAHHPIIGSRVAEASSLEPLWRNWLRIEDIEWCQDHRIGSDVVFPGTGYLAMAGEALRQLCPEAQDISFRQVTILSALVLGGTEATETLLSMCRHKVTNHLDSAWWEFSISSYNETSQLWAKHAFGQVRDGRSESDDGRDQKIVHLPHEVDARYWYNTMRSVGQNYGTRFQRLDRISTHLLDNEAVADLKPDETDPNYLFLHPATSDACMQLFSAAMAHGQARSLHVKAVPTYIGEAYFKRTSAHNGSKITVGASINNQIPGSPMVGTCVAVDAANAVVLRLKDVKLTPLDEGENDATSQQQQQQQVPNGSQDPHAGARLRWRPDFDFQDAAQLIRSQSSSDGMVVRKQAYYLLQKLLLLCCVTAQDQYGQIQPSKPYLAEFQKWMTQQATQVRDASAQNGDGDDDVVYPLVKRRESQEFLGLNQEQRATLIKELVEDLRETEYGHVGKLIHRVYLGLGDLLNGHRDGLEILRQEEKEQDVDADRDEGEEEEDPLTNIYNISNQGWNYAPFLELLSHRTPHLRILEIGAGTGGTTDLILRQLDRGVGENSMSTAFYSYTYTDVSAGFFPAAMRRFPRHRYPNIRFQTLDISSDPETQGFAPASFDLIVAANVLHATPELGRTLAHVRKLLRPDGRLLLQEISMEARWVNLIMGVLPGWWLGGEDGRKEEPYVAPARWAEELRKAGFSSPSVVLDVDEEPFQANATIVAAPAESAPLHANPDLTSAVSLLCRQPDSGVAKAASDALKKLGFHEVDIIGLSDTPRGTTVISILDIEEEKKAFIRDDTPAEEYRQVQDFISTKIPPPEAGGCLLWLTRPSQMHCTDPQYAAIVGLLRVVRNETGLALCTLEMEEEEGDSGTFWKSVVDVYHKILRTRSSTQPQDGMASPDCEFAYRRGSLYLPRFHWVSVSDELVATELQTPDKLAGNANGHLREQEQQRTYKRLETSKRGSLESLHWTENRLPLPSELASDEVIISIRAVGLNFKDTLTAMGLIPSVAKAGDGFGVECSGVVLAAGPIASDTFHVGDRVMAVSRNAYATATVVRATNCVRIPDELSFEDAATMPCVYPTAIHAIVNLARLERGQTILIHSACGAVGLAAMHVCLNVVGVPKSDIYATVSSPEKTEFLTSTFGLSPSHIFQSRSAAFLPGVLRATENRGLDLVLNSLSGPLLHASWSCVAEFGSMVELGKRDFLDGGRLEMAPFEGNRTFYGLELVPIIEQRPALFRKLLTEQTMRWHKEGLLPPIGPVARFEADEVVSALRKMQGGNHIGKLVVRMWDDGRADHDGLVISSESRTRTTASGGGKHLFRENVTYLLVGGLGGLGRSIAFWMVQNGARHFVFLSRSGGAKPEVTALVRSLQGAGCTVHVVAGSVTNPDDVSRAIGQAHLPVAGVLQLSMVLRDGLFANMPHEDWAAATAPKIQGTWNLYHALSASQQSLDFFVLFSSFAGVIGSRGQANYSAANVFLDAFAQFGQSKGLPVAVLDVGSVADVGFVAEQPDLLEFFKTTSHHILREQHVLDALELAVRQQQSFQKPLAEDTAAHAIEDESFVSNAQLVLALRSTMPLSMPNNRNVWTRDPRMSLYRNLEAAATDHHDDGANSDKKEEGEDAAVRKLLNTIETNPSVLTDDETFILGLARSITIAVYSFMMKPYIEDEVDMKVELTALGFDSLVAIELRNWLRQRLKLEVTVLEIMRSGSLIGLARFGARKWSSAATK